MRVLRQQFLQDAGYASHLVAKSAMVLFHRESHLNCSWRKKRLKG